MSAGDDNRYNRLHGMLTVRLPSLTSTARRGEGTMVWVKAGVGIIAVLLGLLWLAQGLNLIGGSSMSGHSIFALLGVIVAAVGVALLWSAQRARGRLGVR
jgi:protein-S-isoprenylcysteine O-methyltransferase Ste14